MVVFGENAEEMMEIDGWAGWIFVVHTFSIILELEALT